jgi:hypothetical protein
MLIVSESCHNYINDAVSNQLTYVGIGGGGGVGILWYRPIFGTGIWWGTLLRALLKTAVSKLLSTRQQDKYNTKTKAELCLKLLPICSPVLYSMQGLNLTNDQTHRTRPFTVYPVLHKRGGVP